MVSSTSNTDRSPLNSLNTSLSKSALGREIHFLFLTDFFTNFSFTILPQKGIFSKRNMGPSTGIFSNPQKGRITMPLFPFDKQSLSY